MNPLPADTQAFVTWLRNLPRNPIAADWLDAQGKTIITRAPGRLDVMGGIADYSGSLVLELPLAEATHCALQWQQQPVIDVVSVDKHEDFRQLSVAVEALASGALSTYESARASFASRPQDSWGAYVVGIVLVLMRERGVRFEHGLKFVIRSDVPEGMGVSSSAALEVAIMCAVAHAVGLELDGRELAALCQLAENRVAGAPCGIMDQMTSACGGEQQLLALRCQPAKIEESPAIPSNLAFWGIDSGCRHSVGGSDYGIVRVGTFMGYRIIAEQAGLPAAATGPGQVTIDDPIWHGYLANLTPAEFLTHFSKGLPETIAGAAFLQQYHGTTDGVTRVDPQMDYAVRTPTAHPVWENHRVELFAALLPYGKDQRIAKLLGELMLQSHQSYSACGLGSEGTDELVEGVRKIGPSGGLYGAKITGGGSGGTVAVLGQVSAAQTVQELAAAYARRHHLGVNVFSGSSPGAIAADVVVLHRLTI